MRIGFFEAVLFVLSLACFLLLLVAEVNPIVSSRGRVAPYTGGVLLKAGAGRGYRLYFSLVCWGCSPAGFEVYVESTGAKCRLSSAERGYSIYVCEADVSFSSPQQQTAIQYTSVVVVTPYGNITLPVLEP